MTEKIFRKGVFPTMVTPFGEDGRINYSDLGKFIGMLEEKGAAGLFAVCQSSEMFDLSLEEKIELASFVKDNSHLDVIASGHTQTDLHEQAEAMKAMEQTGIDAVVLISNAFAGKDEDEDIFISNLDKFLTMFRSDIPLGIYECPYPYKRLLSEKEMDFILDTGRFRIMKDTSCDAGIIGKRIRQIGERNFGLYNANAHTIAYSSMEGAAGYSGTHSNISPLLVQFVLDHPIPMGIEEAHAHGLMYDFAEFFMKSPYPVTAKIMLERMGIFSTIRTRVRDHGKVSGIMYEKAYDMLDRIRGFEEIL